ncbi:MAG: lipase family protein [Pseudomonadales bacterium]
MSADEPITPAGLAESNLDLQVAAQCVELSQLAYRDPEQGARVAARSGYTRFTAIDSRGGRDYAIIVSDADRHFVAFRGSDEPLDWLTNLAIWRAKTSMGSVHRGYHRTSQALLPALQAELQSLHTGPVVFTGHSMGGALALLCALGVPLANDADHSIYTFGQPKIGGPSFAEHVRGRSDLDYFRFVHGADAIAVWGLGERAFIGTPCYFDYRGRLVIDRATADLPKVGLHFHRMAQYRYLLRLNQLKARSNEENSDVTIIE